MTSCFSINSRVSQSTQQNDSWGSFDFSLDEIHLTFTHKMVAT